MDNEEKLKAARAILLSGWWPSYAERLRARQAQVRRKLELGSEQRSEDRQRGAIAAFEWALTFLENEIKDLTRDKKDAIL